MSCFGALPQSLFGPNVALAANHFVSDNADLVAVRELSAVAYKLKQDRSLVVNDGSTKTSGDLNQNILDMPSMLPEDIHKTHDGRYKCGGFTFPTLGEAVEFSTRRTPRSDALATPPHAEVVLPEQVPERRGTAKPLPLDVRKTDDGRYSCGGYSFSSLEQALNFSKRRSDRGGNLERSVSPVRRQHQWRRFEVVI